MITGIARVGGNGTDAGAHIVHTINDGVQNGSLADAPEKQTHNAQDLDSATHDDHDAYTAEAGAQPVGDQARNGSMAASKIRVPLAMRPAAKTAIP